jgi:hypothetical protein
VPTEFVLDWGHHPRDPPLPLAVEKDIWFAGLKRPQALMDLTLRTFVLLKYLDVAPALWGANATGVRPEWLRVREQVAAAFDRYLQLFDPKRRSKRYVKPSTRRAQWFE